MLLLFSFLAGLGTGFLFCAWADRRFSKMESVPIQPDKVYLVTLLPDPKEVLWKYTLQCGAHLLFFGKGGRCSTVTTVNGEMVMHYFKSSTRQFTSRRIHAMPNGKIKVLNVCSKKTFSTLTNKNGQYWSLLNNCWGVAW